MDWNTLERLRIYTGEFDRFERAPVFEQVVKAAHDHGLAGATVLRGMMGFGGHSEIHTAKILRLSEDLPIIIEIIDTPEKIDIFIPAIQTMLSQGLMTREPVSALILRK
jgi:PII-like signaling protein